MTADRPDPMELMGELDASILGLVKLLPRIFPQFMDGETAGGAAYAEAVQCASKLPALHAAIEAMQIELDETRIRWGTDVEALENRIKELTSPTSKGG